MGSILTNMVTQAESGVYERLRSAVLKRGKVRQMKQFGSEEPVQIFGRVAEDIRRIQSELGVFVGGYAFLDPREEGSSRPLLFRESGLGERGHQVFQLPWRWSSLEGERFASLIDSAFYAWRSRERPSSSLPSVSWPEYTTYLGTGSGYRSLSRGGGQFEFLYAPVGEVACFLLTWRALIASAQRLGGASTLEQFDAGPPPPLDSLWANTVADLSSREKDWSSSIRGDAASLQNGRLWSELATLSRRPCSGCGSQCWTPELLSLGFLRGQPTGTGEFWPTPWFRALWRFFDHWSGQPSSASYDDRSPLDCRSVEGLMREALPKMVRLLLGVSWAEHTVQDGLTKLHTLARFPVIPYYLWWLLDGGGKSHLVLPAWRDFSVTARIPTAVVWGFNGEEVGFANEETHLVGTMILGVEPIKNLDWTTAQPDHPDNGDEQVIELQQLADVLAPLPVSYVYYGQYKRHVHERDQRERERRSFAHRTIDLISSIHEFVCMREERSDPTLVAMTTTLLAAVTLFRRQRVDLDKPFPGVGQDPITFFLELGCLWALHRAKSFTATAGNALELIDRLEPYYSLTSALSIDLRQNSLPRDHSLLFTERFGVMFVHCCAQSVFHGFAHRCRFPRSRLVTEVEASRADDGSIRIVFINAGRAPRPGAVASKDSRELVELAAHFLPDGWLTGPKWDGSRRRWITAFSIGVKGGGK